MVEKYKYTYILTFNKTTISKEIQIRYYLKKVEKYIPVPLRCFKWQKYGYHKESCWEYPICERCSQKDPNHMKEDCSNENKCSNCQENHTAFSRSCSRQKRERKMVEIKCKKDTLLEVRKMMVLYMKEDTYTNVAQIFPIAKNQSSTLDPTNYQPFALANCIYKMLERMINTKVTWYLEKKSWP